MNVETVLYTNITIVSVYVLECNCHNCTGCKATGHIAMSPAEFNHLHREMRALTYYTNLTGLYIALCPSVSIQLYFHLHFGKVTSEHSRMSR